MSWDSLFSPASSTGYYARSTNVISSGDTILLGLRFFPEDTSSTGAIFRSTNGGTTWSSTYSASRVFGIATASSIIFAATSEGVLYSTNWGETWSPFNTNLPTSSLTAIVPAPSGDTVYVSTLTHGVLKVWRVVTDIGNKETSHPTQAQLHQNYPNPFNPETKIVFELSKRAHTSLVLYDLLGREVRVLVDGVRDRGVHEVSADLHRLESGVYFYKLRAGGFVQTKKMLLLK